jgi:diphthamide synthase (EF-2-diphthine--ammonia ligase)
MVDEGDGALEDDSDGEFSRPPSVEDLVELCRELNERGVRYLVVGGFAIRNAGYPRETGDVDLLMETSAENEARMYEALEVLPDKAVRALKAGEVSQYVVVRVCDEIVVDLMASASGIAYAEASLETVVRVIDGVAIPFASPKLLWRMKVNTHREKDKADLVFLKEHYGAEIFGEGAD